MSLFIASSKALGQLMKFWTGWEIPPKCLDIVVESEAELPKASTCFCLLKLPKRYYEYERFAEDMTMAIGSDGNNGVINKRRY